MTVISYRQALHDTLRAELQRDENRILRYRHVNIGIATTMTLTLSIDHRAVDGAAARFPTDLRELIEQPLDIVL